MPKSMLELCEGFFFYKGNIGMGESTAYNFVVFIVFQCVNVFLNGFSKVRVRKGFVVVR